MRVRKYARSYIMLHPTRSSSVLCCSLLPALGAVYCYLCVATSTLPATEAAVFRSRVIVPMTVVSVAELLCTSWPAADGWDSADPTTEALDLMVTSALSLFDRSSRVEHEASAASARGEAELLDIAEGYHWYAPAHFYLGLMSQTRGELELAVDYYSAALRAGC